MGTYEKKPEKSEKGMCFKNHLKSIKATLVDYPTVKDLEKYIPEFCSITWMEGIEDIDEFLAERKLTRNDIVMAMFNRQTLPTALETVRLTFFLEGLDLTNVTHLIRHRLFSFSAQSTDPRSMENHDILTNDAWAEHGDLCSDARALCMQANELYKKALRRGLTYYDARHYMPRAKESKYFMSGSIKDYLMFLKVRLGRQNQPTSDNILAMRIRQEILRVYPFLEEQIPVEEVQWAYISNIKKKMNLNTFPPDNLHYMKLHSLGISADEIKFDHPKPRDQYTHMGSFDQLFHQIEKDSLPQELTRGSVEKDED